MYFNNEFIQEGDTPSPSWLDWLIVIRTDYVVI